MTQPKPGCFTRVAEGFVGAILGGILCSFLLELRHDRTRGCLDVFGYLAALSAGAVAGFLLPEIIAALVRRGAPEERTRIILGLVAGSLVIARCAWLEEASCISIPLAFCAGGFLFLFVITVIGGPQRAAAAHSPSQVAGERALDFMLEIATGIMIGLGTGIARALLGRSAVTSSSALLFLLLSILGGVGLRLAIEVVFHGRERLAEPKKLLIADGLILGFFVGAASIMPTPPLVWLGHVETGSWLWLFLGPILGAIVGIFVGGVISILLRLVHSGLGKAFLDFLIHLPGSLLGRPAHTEGEGTAPPEAVPAAAGGPQHPGPPGADLRTPRRGRRAVVAFASFCGFSLFSLLALALSCGKTQQVSEDIPRLPHGCPPACNSLRAANWNLEGVLLQGADLTRADLGGAWLMKAQLQRAVLTGAALAGSRLDSANLEGAGLSGADLHGAVLTYANLKNANLRDAKLGRASLHGANLSGADLKDADLGGAAYDEDTTWPRDFDPGKAGAKRE